MNQQTTKQWPRLPLWIIITMVSGTLLLGGVIFSRDYHHERAILNSVFLQRGELLIHSLEMVGRMHSGDFWEEPAESLQPFWDNLEESDSVLFMAITDAEGRPLALAGAFPPDDAIFKSLPPEQSPRLGWRVERLGDEPVYLVYRLFQPLPRMRHNNMMMMHRRGHGGPWGHMEREALPLEPRYAWVAFKMAPFEAASRERVQTAALFILLFCLAGLGGTLALFWGHNARLSREMYEDIKVELEQKRRLATLGGLAAGLAHEIRNPLGAISGLSQHLLNRGNCDASVQESLGVILSSVDRLNSTVTDFLDYARPTEIRPRPVDAAEIMHTVHRLAESDAQSRNVELSLNLPPAPLMIEGDESRLAQAFLNLYLNAIQAAGHRQGGRLTVTAARTGEQVLITFRDNGPGLSPEQLAQAFVPYFTTKAEGTGLGLALVEKCILAHGGSITLASPADGGALVSITLKAKD